MDGRHGEKREGPVTGPHFEPASGARSMPSTRLGGQNAHRAPLVLRRVQPSHSAGAVQVAPPQAGDFALPPAGQESEQNGKRASADEPLAWLMTRRLPFGLPRRRRATVPPSTSGTLTVARGSGIWQCRLQPFPDSDLRRSPVCYRDLHRACVAFYAGRSPVKHPLTSSVLSPSCCHGAARDGYRFSKAACGWLHLPRHRSPQRRAPAPWSVSTWP